MWLFCRHLFLSKTVVLQQNSKHDDSSSLMIVYCLQLDPLPRLEHRDIWQFFSWYCYEPAVFAEDGVGATVKVIWHCVKGVVKLSYWGVWARAWPSTLSTMARRRQSARGFLFTFGWNIISINSLEYNKCKVILLIFS